jgi:uncharacterized protein YrrD
MARSAIRQWLVYCTTFNDTNLKEKQMLIKSTELKGYKLGATDGDIGKVEEFYFDDKHWTVRYLVVNTGRWLTGRKVLLSPYALNAIDQEDHSILLNINQAKIEASPSIESDEPVSKQFENSYYGYYGWPIYWWGSQAWGSSPVLMNNQDDFSLRSEANWDPHLRSTKAVSGYRVEGSDGEVGKIRDFIIDDKTWNIRYLVIETGSWFNEKRVLVSPQWIENIRWDESKVLTMLSREEIRTAPEYNEQALLDRDYESNLYQHYGFDGYWGKLPPHLQARSLKRKFRNVERSNYN